MALAICYLLCTTCVLMLSIFLDQTSYYLKKLAISCKKLVPFARCCTSRNFFLYIPILYVICFCCVMLGTSLVNIAWSINDFSDYYYWGSHLGRVVLSSHYYLAHMYNNMTHHRIKGLYGFLSTYLSIFNAKSNWVDNENPSQRV